MSKFEVGKNYVVRMKDHRSVEVIREQSARERFAYDIGSYLLSTIIAITTIGGLIFPPLFLVSGIAIFLRKRYDTNRQG